MKFIFIIATFYMLISCGENSKRKIYQSPEQVTEKFAVYMLTGDFENAKDFAAPKTVKLITYIEENIKPEKLKEIQGYTVTFNKIECKITTDTTAVCNCDLVYRGENRSEVYNLKKIDNRWLVTKTL